MRKGVQTDRRKSSCGRPPKHFSKPPLRSHAYNRTYCFAIITASQISRLQQRLTEEESQRADLLKELGSQKEKEKEKGRGESVSSL